jgi:hypothetical protein
MCRIAVFNIPLGPLKMEGDCRRWLTFIRKRLPNALGGALPPWTTTGVGRSGSSTSAIAQLAAFANPTAARKSPSTLPNVPKEFVLGGPCSFDHAPVGEQDVTAFIDFGNGPMPPGSALSAWEVPAAASDSGSSPSDSSTRSAQPQTPASAPPGIQLGFGPCTTIDASDVGTHPDADVQSFLDFLASRPEGMPSPGSVLWTSNFA